MGNANSQFLPKYSDHLCWNICLFPHVGCDLKGRAGSYSPWFSWSTGYYRPSENTGVGTEFISGLMEGRIFASTS